MNQPMHPKVKWLHFYQPQLKNKNLVLEIMNQVSSSTELEEALQTENVFKTADFPG